MQFNVLTCALLYILINQTQVRRHWRYSFYLLLGVWFMVYVYICTVNQIWIKHYNLLKESKKNQRIYIYIFSYQIYSLEFVPSHPCGSWELLSYNKFLVKDFWKMSVKSTPKFFNIFLQFLIGYQSMPTNNVHNLHFSQLSLFCDVIKGWKCKLLLYFFTRLFV